MPSNLVIGETVLFGERGICTCATRTVGGVFGVDRNGRINIANVRIAKAARHSRRVFLGTKMCFGLFSERTSLLTVGGGELQAGRIIDARTRDDHKFESPLGSLGAMAMSDEHIEIVAAVIAKDRLVVGNAIAAPVRGSINAELAVLGCSVRSKKKRDFLLIEINKLRTELHKSAGTLAKLAEVLYAGVEPGDLFFELGEHALAMACFCVRGDFRGHEIAYDSRQHSCSFVVRQEPQSDIHMRLGCSFLISEKIDEFVVSWDDPTWAPILNGWISGKGSFDAERAAATAQSPSS